MTPSCITRTSAFIVLVTYLAFISLGLPDGLLGIAWPYMSERSGVSLDSLGILLISFTSGYLSTSSTSGKIIRMISLGLLLAISCFLTATSLLMYVITNLWFILIVASFFLGAGGGAIDSSINTFAASRFSASTVNWLHAFYGVGATTGPLLVTFMLANNLEWYHGYYTVAIIQVSLSVLFLSTQRMWQINSDPEEKHAAADYFQTLQLPAVWLNIMIFFLYTGLEQGFGQWLFTILTKARNLSEEESGLWTSGYWGSLTVGRILFGIVLTRIPVNKVLIGAMSGIVCSIILFAFNISYAASFFSVILLGLSNAPVFPSLISITPSRIGKTHTATAIGVQISFAMLGGALIPGFAGFLSNKFGLEIITIVFSVTAVLLAILFFSMILKKHRE